MNKDKFLEKLEILQKEYREKDFFIEFVSKQKASKVIAKGMDLNDCNNISIYEVGLTILYKPLHHMKCLIYNEVDTDKWYNLVKEICESLRALRSNKQWLP